MKIGSLLSGGLITNYFCSSMCRHCLYACSPNWTKEFIGEDLCRENFQIIKALGCNSIHIGGGEPLLMPGKMVQVLKVAQDENIGINYIETNASWFQDKKQASGVLTDLMKAGADTLLISISPFHNQHIPFYKVKELIVTCQSTGMAVFPWIQDFYPEVEALDNSKPHSPGEYIETFGRDYFANIPKRYWMHFGGRAAYTYSEIYPQKSLNKIFKSHSNCHELTDTSHFHADLFGNYIPGLCSGLAIKMQDLGKKLDEKEYPLITLLFKKGIQALFSLAVETYNFIPAETYLNKCHLCLEIRRHFLSKGLFENELKPAEFYKNLNPE